MLSLLWGAGRGAPPSFSLHGVPHGSCLIISVNQTTMQPLMEPQDSGPGLSSVGRLPSHATSQAAQTRFSYLAKPESFSHSTLKQGLCSGSLLQQEHISVYTLGGHSWGQGIR